MSDRTSQGPRLGKCRQIENSVPNGASSLGGRGVLVGKRCENFPSSGGSQHAPEGSALAGQVLGRINFNSG